MSMKLTFAAFQELLDGNLEWLRKQTRTLEREHTIMCIEYMRNDREGYEKIPAPRDA